MVGKARLNPPWHLQSNMIHKRVFGAMPNGEAVTAFTLSNSRGCEVEILTLGAVIRRWLAPTAERQDIVLGLDTVTEYLNDPNYFGAVVGRYANRIGQGRFKLNGRTFQLAQNQAEHCLHGGKQGFNRKNWQVEKIDHDSNAITLTLESSQGDEGFPGNLTISTRYRLSDENCLRIEYRAMSDQDTLFNPTQHSYFNLAGHNSGDITKHRIQLDADQFTPADETGLPTGEVLLVASTPFDLRRSVKIIDVLKADHIQLTQAKGLDHNFCLNGYVPGNKTPVAIAKIAKPEVGLSMQVRTTMPGAQVYTGNFIGNSFAGKDGAIYSNHQGLCIETQFYPDAPNKPHFPSARLTAKQPFYSVTEYQLSTTDE